MSNKSNNLDHDKAKKLWKPVGAKEPTVRREPPPVAAKETSRTMETTRMQTTTTTTTRNTATTRIVVTVTRIMTMIMLRRQFQKTMRVAVTKKWTKAKPIVVEPPHHSLNKSSESTWRR